MKATAHYQTENGFEQVATLFGVHTASDVYDRCQTGKARSADVPRDMDPGDKIVLENEVIDVTESGFESVASGPAGAGFASTLREA